MARTAAFRKWNGARMSTHPSPTPFLLRDPLYRVVSCLSSNSHGQRAKSFHFRRKCSVDRSKISRREFEEGFSLPLSLSLFPVYPRFESLLAGNRLLGILVDRGFVPSRPLHHTHTHTHTRAHIFTRDSFERSDRGESFFFFFFLTWSSLLQQVSTTIDFSTTLENVCKGAKREK